MKILEHVDDIAGHHVQTTSMLFQGAIEIMQASQNKFKVVTGSIDLPPQTRLNQVQAQNRTA